MTNLQLLHANHDQSPWLDNLTRTQLRRGELEQFILDGVRGITSNPTIFARAILDSNDYNDQICALLANGASATDVYWEVVINDVLEALTQLQPVYEASAGEDGFVSLEVAPDIADDTERTVAAARALHERISRPNVMVKIPATCAGVPALRQLIAEGANINVTLLFGLERYEQIIEAYLAGLEARTGNLSHVRSVASFFVGRVDKEVDRRLGRIGSAAALRLRGRAALAQAHAAYHLFRLRFSGPRWDALAARGARPQRLLWASTSTKNPGYPDTMYVDGLIAPDTVTTLTESTISAFEDHGTVGRAVENWTDDAFSTLEQLAFVGVDMRDVSSKLEDEGVAAFARSIDELLADIDAKRSELAGK